MPWRSPVAVVQEALRGQRAREKDLRHLVSNLPYEGLEKGKQPNRFFTGNTIKTTKYTLLLFVPMNLFEQFHRMANIYFVGLAILNFVPVVNAFQPEVALIPICVIMSLTALKDAWEDFRRYQSDRRRNNTPCFIYSRREKQFVEKRWKDVRVGDFVRVVCNEIIPADLLLLYTSDPNGVCFIETSNLDGEMNLKQRKAMSGFSVSDLQFEPESFKSIVVCERPNNNLNHFKCYVEKPDQETVGAGIESLLLRGCTVRNTNHAVGFVVYAGHETKSLLNINEPRYKRSKLERKLNIDVIFCVILLFAMCLVGALGHFLWLRDQLREAPYLGTDSPLDSPSLSGFYMFFTMIILLQILIPISLYLSIELVKMGQLFFITNDLDLYDSDTDSCIQVKSLSITEDLGQIEYVFSDKTGTLTENKMVFRRCSIMGTEYAHKENAIRLAILKEPEIDDIINKPTRPPNTGWSRRKSKVAGNTQSDVAFSSPLETEVIPDRKLLQQISGVHSSSQMTNPHLEFFLALAICNTVVVSMAAAHRRRVGGFSRSSQNKHPLDTLSNLVKKTGSLRHIFRSWKLGSKRDRTMSKGSAKEEDWFNLPAKTEASGVFDGVRRCSLHAPENPALTLDELCFEAESPDEAALVHAAKAYSVTLLARSPHSVTVGLPSGDNLVFKVLDILTFDPVRKRMSVLVRHPVTREYLLYTKGADYAIMELLGTPYAEHLSGNEKKIAADTQHHLDCYAKDGLRTLCFTKKVVSEKTYKSWSISRQRALAAIENREQLVMDSAVQLETNLSLLGATGIEDRLQEGVPDTMAALREAGVQVWVLTGDKPETALNIGYACRLLEEESLVINMSCNNKIRTSQRRDFGPLIQYLTKLSCTSILDCTLEEVRRYRADPRNVDITQDISLVIDGHTLTMALSSDLQERFVELARGCRSVLCCRVTPLQKSNVVKVIKDRLKVMTLAVGDGANDVNMIQAADIGIGISGQEGMQAVMASDFAISRFKHLNKLLLVHGHWCYTRLANMIIYFFYKNVAYVNLLFWYQFFSGFSGTAMIDYWLMIFFNLFFTSVPPIMFGIMDKDLSAEMLLGVPELYRSGQGTGVYRSSTFWISILDAFYQSLVCFFIPYLAYQDSDVDLFSFGTPLNTISLFIILLHLSIEIKTWTVVHWVIMLGSVALFFLVTVAYSGLCVTCNPPSNPYWIVQKQMADPMFYLICTITTVVALLPRYMFHVLQNSVAPSPIVHARHVDQLAPDTRDQMMKEWRGFRAPEWVRRHSRLCMNHNSAARPDIYPMSPTTSDLGDEFTLNVIS